MDEVELIYNHRGALGPCKKCTAHHQIWGEMHFEMPYRHRHFICFYPSRTETISWLTYTHLPFECDSLCVCASVDGVWEISMIFSPLLTSIFSETEWGCQTNRKICKWSWNVCVCVDHLHRCKTSFCLFCAFVVGSTRFSCHVCRGAGSRVQSLPANEDTLVSLVISWPDHPDVPAFFQFSSMGPAKPSTGMSFKTVSISALLSQSGIILFYFEFVASEPSSEQGRRKHTSNWISRWINQFLLSDFTGLFVHVRCIPHQ